MVVFLAKNIYNVIGELIYMDLQEKLQLLRKKNEIYR